MGVLFQLIGLAAVAFAFWVIKWLCTLKSEKPSNFSDFIIGDEGTYSLSRLQMVAWAYFIISFQVSAMIAVWFHSTGNQLNRFNLVFSEEILWLLGLSLGSYVTVKGITVERIIKNKRIKTKSKNPADLIIGSNGLDFSKFQMMIWTIIGIAIYVAKCHQYLCEVIHVSYADELAKYFIDPKDESLSKLPGIDMSFIVLMGLSQGAYLGKKLVPAFKVEQVKKKLTSEFRAEISALDIGIKFQENELVLMKNQGQYPMDELEKIEKNLAALKQKRNERKVELDDLDKQTS